VVLTWGTGPCDLDAHLSGPICGTTPAERFHVNRLDMNPVPYAELDEDQRHCPGREEITVRPADGGGKWIAGEYDFWVHNYAESAPEFGSSDAVVTVFSGAVQRARYVVGSEPGVGSTELDIWRVVNIMIDEDGTLTLNREGRGFLSDDPEEPGDPQGGNVVPDPVTETTFVDCP